MHLKELCAGFTPIKKSKDTKDYASLFMDETLKLSLTKNGYLHELLIVYIVSYYVLEKKSVIKKKFI